MSNEEVSNSEVDSEEVVAAAEEVVEELGDESAEAIVGEIVDEIDDGATEEDSETDSAEENVTSDETNVDVLQLQLAETMQKVQAADERALRITADLQNVRRRAEKDVQNAHKYAVDKFVQELLPVIDGLERGLDAVSEEDEALKTAREGMVLTHKLFLDALKKFNVEAIEPLGEPFDPNLHEAVSMQPNPDAEPNSVMTVFQKGYTLSGRLIRPAMVVVAKG